MIFLDVFFMIQIFCDFFFWTYPAYKVKFAKLISLCFLLPYTYTFIFVECASHESP